MDDHVSHREKNKKESDGDDEEEEEYEVQDFKDRIKSSRGSRFNLIEKEFGLVNNTESSSMTSWRRKLSRESVINGLRYVSSGFVIHPDNRWYRAWTKSFYYGQSTLPSLHGFFRGLPENLFILDIVGQVAFLLDIIFQFFIAYRDSQTYRTVYKRTPIALRYLKSHFIIDLLACLPWDIIYKKK
uniref:Ion transport domain-containing protein n=1 Tax=Salix viminalis TaxID=40686 RepID=A0A6N2N749_SALVM